MKNLSFCLLFSSTLSFAGEMGSAALMMNDGLYGGVGVGSMAWTYKATVSGSIPAQIEYYGKSGVLGDVFGGYNLNLTPWFNLGAEVFYTFYGLSHQLTGGNPEASSQAKNQSNWGVKLAPGINLNSYARVFADVGYTNGQFKYYPSSFAVAFASPTSYTNNLSGLMVGAGTELALSEHCSLRAEYQYLEYANWTIHTPLMMNLSVDTQFNHIGNQFIGSFIYYFDV